MGSSKGSVSGPEGWRSGPAALSAGGPAAYRWEGVPVGAPSPRHEGHAGHAGHPGDVIAAPCPPSGRACAGPCSTERRGSTNTASLSLSLSLSLPALTACLQLEHVHTKLHTADVFRSKDAVRGCPWAPSAYRMH